MKNQRFSRPHHDYYRQKNICDQVFEHFHTIKKGSLAKIGHQYQIPDSTIRGWYQKWLINPKWRPYDGSVHGLHHRIFTNAEEESIAEFIRANYIRTGLLFQNQDFKTLASQAFLEKYDEIEEVPEPMFSAKFVSDFKKRNGLSSRKARYKRRPNTDQNDIDKWMSMIKELIESKPSDRILNADETAWRILPSTMSTWADVGSDSISVSVSDDAKKMITVMATITSAGTKLPLFMIAKGKTAIAEKSQLGDISYHMSAHSQSGWMEQECFEVYLKWLRQQYNDDEPLYLLLDQFPVHISESSKSCAKSLKIELFYIPAGATDKYQPLDRRVFGCLKSSSSKKIHDILVAEPQSKIGTKKAIEILIWAWEHLSNDVLTEAWSIYIE